MSDVNLDGFWELVGWVFALDGHTFQTVSHTSYGLTLALGIVLLAGLSQAAAQSIILFINRVQPLRFVFSLLLNAVLFVAGFLFLVLSTWLITLLPWSVSVPLSALIIVLGLSYAPLLFSILGALPYFGVPILNGLSIWHLLAMVTGFANLTDMSLGGALSYVAFGWVVLQLFQQTVGRPIARLGQWLTNTAAGVELATSRQDVIDIIRRRVEESSTQWSNELRQRFAEVRQGNVLGALTGEGTTATAIASATQAILHPHAPRQPSNDALGSTLRTFLALVGIVLLTVLTIVLLGPVREWLFGWHNSLPGLFRLVFDLVWIGLIVLVVAGLLAPLETLGWWAGWYDDEIDTVINAGDLATPVDDPEQISRYIVYLDGIGKSNFEYLPDIETFLNALAPTLPEDVALVRGIMPYSVVNNPLNEDRPLAFLWKAIDQIRLGNPAALLGLLINIRNILVVGVSADKRYGPLYNQGIAQVVYNGLLKNGYRPRSGTPITLLGYSGGGQMACASAPILKRALGAPIDVISLGGVISANCNVLKLEHLYHLVGEHDSVEQLGPIMFPGRWKLFPLSFWNRAKRRGKISVISMGPVGHQVPGGLLDPELILPSGISALEQTIQTIHTIVQGEALPPTDLAALQLSNYERYQVAAFNRPGYYPLDQPVDPTLYRPIGLWIGRLILPKPEQRRKVRGVFFEVHHAEPPHAYLIGQTVMLRWVNDPLLKELVKAVTKDVYFSAEATYTSKYGGLVHPDRLNHWLQVGPLESLAGSHPTNDVVVMLDGPVVVDGSPETAQPVDSQAAIAPVDGESLASMPVLYIQTTPIQITGRYYGLVKFIEPVVGTDAFRVVHFNRASRQFDGPETEVRLPPVVTAAAYGSDPSTSRGLERSPVNESGWYIYGANDANGQFVVQSLAPRALLQLRPERVVFGAKAAYDYIRRESWAEAAAHKGGISSVLCSAQPDDAPDAVQRAIADWQDDVSEAFPTGTRALVLHTYGGIGGAKKEPAAATPIFFGHFAYGLAEVVYEPLADEQRFDIRYYQVYTHNTDGIIAGILHWSCYMGDRQTGWLGNRPVCDILVKLDAFTGYYDFDGIQRSPLNSMLGQLQAMTARYRIGDGTGGTYVGPANNCSQDSNQALFASIQTLGTNVRANVGWLKAWATRNPEQADRFKQLMLLGKELKLRLQPLGKPRADWEKNEYNLGCTLEDEPLRNLLMGLGSWRTLLPRKASDTVVHTFLKYGASVWVLRTNQVGGDDPDIEPIAPITL